MRCKNGSANSESHRCPSVLIFAMLQDNIIARRLPRRFLEMLIASVGEMFLQIFS